MCNEERVCCFWGGIVGGESGLKRVLGEGGEEERCNCVVKGEEVVD